MSKMWLVAVLVILTAAVVGAVAVAVVVTRRGVELLPADSPEGVVQRYLLALEEKEYAEAREYWSSDVQRRCPLEQFTRWDYWGESRDEHLTLEETRRSGDSAVVRVRVTRFDPDVPFGGSEHHYYRTYNLKLEEGEWRLTWHDLGCPPPF